MTSAFNPPKNINIDRRNSELMYRREDRQVRDDCLLGYLRDH